MKYLPQVFHKDKKKWPHPGKAWIKVYDKSLQKEVDRMLELIYDAVGIAGEFDPQQPQMGAGLSKVKEEEEEMNEQGRYSIHFKNIMKVITEF